MTGWLLEALVGSALLMLAVLALRGPVRRAFGAQVAYALWALPVLRLLLPPLPASWTEAAALPIAQAGEVVAVFVVPAGEPLAAPAATLPWGVVLMGLWAIGAAVFLGAHWWRHRRFCARLLAEATPVAEVDGVRIVESPAAAGPLAFGTGLSTRGRFVAFPFDFAERYDADERDLALAHELGHHARGDLIANWIAIGVLALHWFNPLAWRAHRAFRCDQELANDARVLAACGGADRHAYARAIVKAAHGRAVSPACHLHTPLNLNGTDLKGRLRMLTRTRPSRRRAATGLVSVAALVTAGLAATASGTEAAAAVNDAVVATGAALAVQAAPVAPAPVPAPVPPVAVAPPAPLAGASRINRIVVVRDGKAATYEGAAADAYAAQNGLPLPPAPPMPGAPGTPPMPGAPVQPPLPPLPPLPAWDGAAVARAVAAVRAMPTIMSGPCRREPNGSLSADAMTVTRMDGGKRMMVICTDRIAAAAERGMRARRDGLATALASIKLARGAISDNRELTDAQRREALEGLDQAVKELREEARD